MTPPFVYQALPSRVVFRPGAFGLLREEVARLGTRALVLSTPEQAPLARAASERLGPLAVGLFDRATMHVPAEIAKAACELAAETRADCCVAIGGGSTIGLGKAIALARDDVPIVAVPTTYAGSEMTPIWGLTENGLKRTGRDLKVLPRTVLYDPELTLTLPATLSGVSGLNAIAHCVEALYAADGNPVVALMAEEGVRALAESLPKIVEAPAALDARTTALYGAWLAGACLGSVAMALHHKLCHTLGGSFGLPHAETHAVLIPYVAAFNLPAAPEAARRLARALGVSDVASSLRRLGQAVGAPVSLAELGFTRAHVADAAALAVANSYPNPRRFDEGDIRALLTRAVDGAPVG